MADKKISELTELTTPDGTEELVVNDSGVSKKITQTNLLSTALPLAGGTMTGTIAGFTSTGIDDNATSTAITIDASENVGIGAISPSNPLEIQHGTVGTGNGANNTLALRYNSSTLYGQHYMDANGIYHILADYNGVAGGNMQLGADTAIRLATANTERMRIDSAGDVTVNSGNLVIGTSGKGIDFSADGNAAGMTSEVLDDYEQGTFTATLTAATAPTTACTTTGHYTKIGNVCHFSIYRFEAVNTTGASGHMKITGLPFTAATSTTIPAPFTHGFNFDASRNQNWSLDGTNLAAYESTSGGAWSQWNITAGTTKYMVVNGTYRAD